MEELGDAGGPSGVVLPRDAAASREGLEGLEGAITDRDAKPGNVESTGEPAAVGGDVVASLAVALERATAAGRWDVAALLVGELQARRLASLPNVVAIGAKRRPGG